MTIARPALERCAKPANLSIRKNLTDPVSICVNELGAQGREISKREGGANRQYEFETSY